MTESFGHSDIDPALVEAGARAIGKHRPGYGWERDEDTWRPYLQIVEWALAAVEPLIREHIAQQIIDGCIHKGHFDAACPCYYAAAIARGQT